MTWDLKFFSEKEFQFPEKMDHWFLRQLDQYRTLVNIPFKITEDFATTGHEINSMHYRGRAVDGHFQTEDGVRLSAIDQLLLAIKSPFFGIGIYTWSPNGAFLHLDNRSSFDRKIWVCEEKGKYRNLDAAFFKRSAQ